MKLDEDGYKRPNVTLQDKISEDTDEMYDLLKNHIKIHAKDHKYIPIGVKVKYINGQGKFRHGGIVIVNSAPDYIVLKNIKKCLTWSVNLQTNIIFMEDRRQKEKEIIEKDKLYRLFKEGLIEFKIPEDVKS